VLLSLALIYSSLLTHYFSLGIHSCMVYILLLADSLYPFLHSAPSIYCVPRHTPVAEPKSHTKIWITCAGKYFNLLSMYIMSNITSSAGVVSKQYITKWMGEGHVTYLGKQAESRMCKQNLASRGSISKHVFTLSHAGVIV